MIENNHPYFFRRLDRSDFDNLCIYLNRLSPETRKRFGPHAFDKQSIIDFYSDEQHIQLGYIVLDLQTNQILAYAIIKTGYLEHDRLRLESYGFELNADHDCTFAPSVADNLQGQGLGKGLFQFILADLKTRDMRRIILWGGVQANNERAIQYYLKNGFIRIGQFEHNGTHYDMVLTIPPEV